MLTRVADGGARVVRELRVAAPLASTLDAPVTARGPWLTVALHAGPVCVPRARPRAVVVEAHQQGRPAGVALLSLRRWGPVTSVRLLGDGDLPDPPGAPPRRLPAADDDTARQLAEGLADLLASLPGRWALRLQGLPLGDPVLSALAARLGTGASFRTTRTRALVDRLDTLGQVHRSPDPADLERWLPALLARRPAGTARAPLRAAVRVHAAIGGLEHAVVVREDRVVAGLVTLVDRGIRRPWWGWSDVGGLDTVPGQPSVSLTAASWSVSLSSARR